MSAADRERRADEQAALAVLTVMVDPQQRRLTWAECLGDDWRDRLPSVINALGTLLVDALHHDPISGPEFVQQVGARLAADEIVTASTPQETPVSELTVTPPAPRKTTPAEATERMLQAVAMVRVGDLGGASKLLTGADSFPVAMAATCGLAALLNALPAEASGGFVANYRKRVENYKEESPDGR